MGFQNYDDMLSKLCNFFRIRITDIKVRFIMHIISKLIPVHTKTVPL